MREAAMSRKPTHVVVLAAAVLITAWVSVRFMTEPTHVSAEQRDGLAVRTGTVAIDFDRQALKALGWEIVPNGPKEEIAGNTQTLTFPIQPSSSLRVESLKELRGERIVGTLRTWGAMLVAGAGDGAILGNLVFTVDADGVWTVASTFGEPDRHQLVFDVSTVATDFSARDDDLRALGDLSVARAWADRLGLPEAAGMVLGVMRIEAQSAAEGGVAAADAPVTIEQTTDGGGTCRTEGGVAAGTAGTGTTGSDVIVAELQAVRRFGRVGDITAYAVGTNACNIGDERASWVKNTNDHPVIIQNMYRFKQGRFEQIGMSWVKHGFYAISKCLCGNCCGDGCCDPTDGSELGVGCSDPYDAGLNGQQSIMSRLSEVNPHTGDFPYPFTPVPTQSVIDKRIQVRDADIEPDLNPDALYFVQGHYVHPDDSRAGTGDNSVSYRRVIVSVPPPPAAQDTYNVLVTGVTQREQPALRAWQDTDSSVVETDARVPGEGLFIVSAKTTDLGNGFWHYEYAVQNLNSDRSAGSFSVPFPRGALVQNLGFHDVNHHSGEIYDVTDWPPTVGEGWIKWETQAYNVNPNGNALRFSTLYNFRFDANVGPGPTVVTLGLFKPGFPESLEVRTMGPSQDIIDCNSNGIADVCDIECGTGCAEPCGGSSDCNANDVPDECEADCNQNGVADQCDIADCPVGELWCADCNANMVPDGCEPDCDHDGVPDSCDTFDDADGDGIADCWDLCPYTTPPQACTCPPSGRCCFPSVGICIDDYPRFACIEQGGVPDCLETPCRDGCLIGDFDDDGDRDLWDVGAFQRCFGGPFGEPGYVTPSVDCLQHGDFNEDDDMDLSDFRELRVILTGP
jgi:hypothetical protein